MALKTSIRNRIEGYLKRRLVGKTADRIGTFGHLSWEDYSTGTISSFSASWATLNYTILENIQIYEDRNFFLDFKPSIHTHIKGRKKLQKIKKIQRITAFTELFYNQGQFTHWVSIKAEGVTLNHNSMQAILSGTDVMVYKCSAFWCPHLMLEENLETWDKWLVSMFIILPSSTGRSLI